jgi:hypothetical protein
MRIIGVVTYLLFTCVIALCAQEEPKASAQPVQDTAQTQAAAKKEDVKKAEDAKKEGAVAEKPAEEKTSEPVVEKPAEQVASAAAPDKSIETVPFKSLPIAGAKEKSVKPASNAIILPALPEPTVDEEMAMPEKEEEEPRRGIDTVSLEEPQGNWLFKRVWWERAEDRYGKIRALVDKIWESRTTFFIKRNELDRKVLDPFYVSIGVGQGELQIIITELNDFFEKERERQGDLSEQERTLYETLVVEQEALKQLKADVESITALDRALDDALGMLMDQINRVRQFEKQAWDNFKEIAHLLSDTKARELYYMIEGAGRNIKNISTYLEQDFLNHFTKLIDQAKKHITRVTQQINALKEKGVDFKRQVDRIAQQEAENKQKQMAQELAEEEEVRPKPKKGWIDWTLSLPKNIWDYIVGIVQIPYNMIFGKK